MDAVDSGVALLLLDVAAAKRHLKEVRQACRDTQLSRDAGTGAGPQGEQSLLDQLRALHEENLRLRTRLKDEQQARRKLEEDYAELTAYMRSAQDAAARRGWETPPSASPAHQQQHSSSLTATPNPGAAAGAAAPAAKAAGVYVEPHSGQVSGVRPHQQHSAYFGDTTCTSPAAHPLVTSPCSGSLPSPCRLLSPSPPNGHAQHSLGRLAAAAQRQPQRPLPRLPLHQQGQGQGQGQGQWQDLPQHPSRALWHQAEAAHLPQQHNQHDSVCPGVHSARSCGPGSTGGGGAPNGMAGGGSSWRHPAAGQGRAAAAAAHGHMPCSKGGSSDSSSSLEELVDSSLAGVMGHGGGTSSAASRLAQLLMGTATAATTTSSSSPYQGRGAQQSSVVPRGEQQATALMAEGQEGVQEGFNTLWNRSRTTISGSANGSPWQPRAAAPCKPLDSPLRSAAAWLAAGGGPAAAAGGTGRRWDHSSSSTRQQHPQQSSPSHRQHHQPTDWEEGLSGTDSDVSEEHGEWQGAVHRQHSTPSTARQAPVSLQQMEQLQAELAVRMHNIRQQLINISGGMGAEAGGSVAHTNAVGQAAAAEASSHGARPQHLGSSTSPGTGGAGEANSTATWLQQAGWYGSAHQPGTGASRDPLGHVQLEALLEAHWPQAAAAAAAAAVHDSAAAGRPASSSSRAYDSACSSDWEAHCEEGTSPDLLQAAAGWPAAARPGQPHLQQGQQGMATGGPAGSTEPGGPHRGDVYSAQGVELHSSSAWQGRSQEGCDPLSVLRATRSLPTL